MKSAVGDVLFLLLVVLLYSCHNRTHSAQDQPDQPIKQENDYVTFLLNDKDSSVKKKISFYYQDSVSYGHPVYITKIYTKVQLNAPAFFFRPNAEQTPFFVYPGDTIHIKSTVDDFIEMYIEGNQQKTNELNFFAKLVQQTGSIYYAFTSMPYHKKVASLNDIKNLENTINDVKMQRFKFFKSYAKQAPISDAFGRFAVNTINSTALTDTLILYFNNREFLRKHNLYQRALAEKIVSIRSIGLASSQIYYRTCTMLTSLSLGDPPNYLIQSKAEFIKRFDFVENNFSGTTRDFLMAHTLTTAYNNSISVPAAYMIKFDKLCKEPGYRNLINRTFNARKSILSTTGTNNLLSTDGKTIQEMQSVISKYKGKILLLDFWASWCGPCRLEIPYLQSLEKYYENKNVAFVSISTDQKQSDWLRAIKEESLADRDNFLLMNADRSTFVQRYRIYTIPRYLLIGKEGNIISKDAPRPSDPKLKALVNKHL